MSPDEKRAKTKAGPNASPGPATGKTVEPIREMGIDEFVRRLKIDGTAHEKKFAFFLGAGCSVTSGIPAASTLVSDRWIPRLRDVRAPQETDHLAWAERTLLGYDKKNAAASYGQLIKELFVTPDDRQREIESLCDARSPAFGYAVLAQLVAGAGSRFNVVLTTNFDDLVADALYLFTDSRPLVIQHESLAAFIRPTRTRPLIVKLHGDHRLAPRNTALETEALEAEIARHTAMVLNDRGVIFMGYGGSDKGILKLLNDLPVDALPAGAYWVHPEKPTGGILNWLLARQGVWVKSGWFDEVMLLARNAFELSHPQPDRLTRVFTDYQSAFEDLSKAIAAKPAADINTALLKHAVTETERSFPDFWGALAEARRLEDADRSGAEDVYKRAIAQFPDAARLHTFYGGFLERDDTRHPEAEHHLKRATEVDPSYAYSQTMYAQYLEGREGRREEAEAFHRRAAELDSRTAWTIASYASYLEETPGRREEAEAVYRRAIERDPQYAYAINRYAMYLEQTPARRAEAEAFYRRAIETKPDYSFAHARYAYYLEATPGRRADAEAAYRRAIEAGPDDPVTFDRYAAYLEATPGRRAEAEPLYRRALEISPESPYHRQSLVSFLRNSPGRETEADEIEARKDA